LACKGGKTIKGISAELFCRWLCFAPKCKGTCFEPCVWDRCVTACAQVGATPKSHLHACFMCLRAFHFPLNRAQARQCCVPYLAVEDECEHDDCLCRYYCEDYPLKDCRNEGGH
jgi:hypothetical protein